jgi:predicted P-loop ATPase
MPKILATQEAEIRRIMVQSQPRQIVHKTLSRKNPSQRRAGGVAESVDPAFKPSTTKKQKKKKRKRKPQEGYVVAHGRSMLEFWS